MSRLSFQAVHLKSKDLPVKLSIQVHPRMHASDFLCSQATAYSLADFFLDPAIPLWPYKFPSLASGHIKDEFEEAKKITFKNDYIYTEHQSTTLDWTPRIGTAEKTTFKNDYNYSDYQSTVHDWAPLIGTPPTITACESKASGKADKRGQTSGLPSKADKRSAFDQGLACSSRKAKVGKLHHCMYIRMRRACI